jgi:ubiquinone/menaquinone biosynthesis C-methylase UbiE
MKGCAGENGPSERALLRQYYRENPLMVSSPFGGVDGVNRDLLLEIWRQLGISVTGKRILDVGCGRGYVEAVVHEQGGEYVGIDFVISRAGFPLVLADAAQMPFPDAIYDGVLCIDAFEHFPNPERVAHEFRRVLRPAGFVFLSAPNYANVAGLVKWYCEHLGHYRKDTWAPFRQWQPQELEHALTAGTVRRCFQRAGFAKMRRLGHGAEAGLGLFPWLAHPRMPEAILFRLQRLFAAVGPPLARIFPAASLHHFWKIERCVDANR